MISPTDIIKAEAIAVALGAMIGSRPAVVNVDDQYLEVRFSDAQREQFIRYLDQRVQPLYSGKPQAAPAVQVRWGDVLVPWSVKYLAPAILAVFAMGFLSNSVLFPRGR